MFATPYRSKFPQDHCDDRVTGCRGESVLRATFFQALCITGSVLLLLEANDEDSESTNRKKIPGYVTMSSGSQCVNLLLHKSENSVVVLGGGIVQMGVFIQTLGTMGTVVLLVEPDDDREPLPSIIESKSVLGGAACGCDTWFVKL